MVTYAEFLTILLGKFSVPILGQISVQINRESLQTLEGVGGQGQNRTADTRIFSLAVEVF